MKKLNEKIIEFENQDISYNDVDDQASNYLKESKLKERFVKAYNKLLNYCKKYPHLVSNDFKKSRAKGAQFSKKIKINCKFIIKISKDSLK